MSLSGCSYCRISTAGLHEAHCPLAHRIEAEPKPTAPLQGWMCPRCGRCYSPFTSMCGACQPQTTVATTSNWEPGR